MSSQTEHASARTTEFEEDPRYRIAGREALLCFGYWAVFTVGAVIIAWLLGHRDPSQIGFIMGFPDWFFWSALAFVAVMAIPVPYLIVKLGFTDMDLEPEPQPGTPGAVEVRR